MVRLDISELKVKDVRTVNEAAAELGVKPASAHNLIKQGRLDYGMRGETKLVPESAVRKRMATNPGSGNPRLRGIKDASDLPPVPGGYVSAQDAADILGCSRQNVYQLVERGTLKGGRFDDDGIARMHVSLSDVMARKRGK